MQVNRSKSGLPTVSENGGGMSNTGFATLICGSNGQKLKPLFVPRGYANGEHAIFVLKPGMLIVDAEHSRQGESVNIAEVIAIGNDSSSDEIVLSKMYSYENGDGTIASSLQEVKKAALEKAHCYHCREVHYAKDK